MKDFIKPDRDSHFKLLPCGCGSGDVGYEKIASTLFALNTRSTSAGGGSGSRQSLCSPRLSRKKTSLYMRIRIKCGGIWKKDRARAAGSRIPVTQPVRLMPAGGMPEWRLPERRWGCERIAELSRC